MKILFLFAIFCLTIALSACNIDGEINPVFDGASYSTVTYDAFEATIDGVPTVHRFGAGYYNCNPADLLTYVFDTNGAVPNADSTQASCTTELFTHSDVFEDLRPVAVKP